MKKIITVIVVMIFTANVTLAQSADEKKPLIYHPEANVADEYAAAIRKAMKENKHVLLEVGGNWCKWCIVFNKFTTSDAEIDSMMNANYVMLHVNYSKENKNLPFLETLQYPQRLGFPVFVVLNAQGQRLHTQNSWYLEDGNKEVPGYDKEKTMAFLKDWSPAALDPKNYEKKK